MNILVWHVHGSWTTAFVQGSHRLLPTLPEELALAQRRPGCAPADRDAALYAVTDDVPARPVGPRHVGRGPVASATTGRS